MTPDSPTRELTELPTDDAEQPGMGSAIGAVAGGAAGAAAASLFVPPAGALAIVGIAAAALLGGFGGAATGEKMEEAGSFGLSRDELFVYAHALGSGRSIVIAWVESDDQIALVRVAMSEAGVDDIDAARETWWVGLRDAEAVAYGDAFDADEPRYREGFEAACRGEDPNGGPRHPAFDAGYARGRAYVAEQARQLAVTRPAAVGALDETKVAP